MKNWNKLFSALEVGLGVICVLIKEYEVAKCALLLAVVFAVWSLDDR